MSNIPNAKSRYFSLVKTLVNKEGFKEYRKEVAVRSIPDYRLEGYPFIRKDFDGTIKTFIAVQNQAGTGVLTYRVGSDNYRMEIAEYGYDELFPKESVAKDKDETPKAKEEAKVTPKPKGRPKKQTAKKD